ncbi:MAG: CPBP family intramembrane glutamic endopeptidase [Planifilum sp.]|jgi:membrane protease YdiL (CAAX protease family)
MIETLVMDAPLLLILWLANMAEDRRYPEVPHMGRGFAIASYVILGLIHLLLLLAGLLMLVVAPFSAEASDFNFPLLVVGMCVPSFVGLLFFIPFVRRLLSRIIPIDPENPVHTVSLSLSMLILFNLLFTLGIGLENIAKLGEQAGNAAVSLSELWAQDITWFLLSLIGVGWLSRRKWREALSRLGVVRPSARDIAFGLGIGLLLVVLAIGFEYGANFFGISVDPEVEKVTEQFLGGLYQSIPGILTLGLAAAIGEETVFRGALQPRFGLLLTSLLFALLHSNYGFSLSTLIVFLVGLALGVVRLRFNTTTAMVVHATYNITLGVIANVWPDL